MAELRLTRRAKHDLSTLPDPVREAVLKSLVLLELEPEETGKRLVGRLQGLWSARVGNYRVLYTIERNEVVIRSIRHRAVAYKSRKRSS